MAFYAENLMELRDDLIVRPPTHLSIGCMLSGFLFHNFKWVLIGFKSKLIIILHKETRSASFVIFERLRWRGAIHFLVSHLYYEIIG